MIVARALRILREEGPAGIYARLRYRVMVRLEKKRSAATITHAEAMKYFEIRHRQYDGLAESVRQYVPADGVFFDVGGNIGFFTHTLAGRLNFRGRVWIFEPLPHLAALCRQTVAGQPYQAVVEEFGLSDADGEVDIYIAGNGNIGWNTLFPDKADANQTKVRIKLKKFDTCGIEAVPDFIKIDVEGAEHLVLRGMMESLRRWDPKPVILCEIGWDQTHAAWPEVLRLFEDLRGIGYEIKHQDGSALDVAKLNAVTDLLFIPKGR